MLLSPASQLWAADFLILLFVRGYAIVLDVRSERYQQLYARQQLLQFDHASEKERNAIVDKLKDLVVPELTHAKQVCARLC